MSGRAFTGSGDAVVVGAPAAKKPPPGAHAHARDNEASHQKTGVKKQKTNSKKGKKNGAGNTSGQKATAQPIEKSGHVRLILLSFCSYSSFVYTNPLLFVSITVLRAPRVRTVVDGGLVFLFTSGCGLFASHPCSMKTWFHPAQHAVYWTF